MLRLSATLLSALLALATPAKAAPCEGLGDLLEFIATETAYPVPTACPLIRRTEAMPSAPGLRSQVGAYQPSTGHILLSADLDVESLLGRSYLLHELVHAAQYRAGTQTRVRCEGELEAEAYYLQTLWLRRMGEFREAMLLDWAAQSLGRCPGDAVAMDY